MDRMYISGTDPSSIILSLTVTLDLHVMALLEHHILIFDNTGFGWSYINTRQSTNPRPMPTNSNCLVGYDQLKNYPLWLKSVSIPTYLRCLADQTRSKYDQPTLYRRPPRCTPAQHTTCGERNYARPFFNRLKNLSRSPRPLRAGPTNYRCISDQHTLSPIKTRSLPIRLFLQSGRERGLIGSLMWTRITDEGSYGPYC